MDRDLNVREIMNFHSLDSNLLLSFNHTNVLIFNNVHIYGSFFICLDAQTKRINFACFTRFDLII